eukprot:SAG31_NODE_277_length_18641_cov_21.357944_15_plen_557_part_00
MDRVGAPLRFSALIIAVTLLNGAAQQALPATHAGNAWAPQLHRGQRQMSQLRELQELSNSVSLTEPIEANVTLRGFISLARNLTALGAVGSSMRAAVQTAVRELVLAEMSVAVSCRSVTALGLWPALAGGDRITQGTDLTTADFIVVVAVNETETAQRRAEAIAESIQNGVSMAINYAADGSSGRRRQLQTGDGAISVVGWSTLAALRNTALCAAASAMFSSAESAGSVAADATTAMQNAELQNVAALAALSSGCGVSRPSRRDARRPPAPVIAPAKQPEMEFELSTGATLMGWIIIAAIGLLLIRKILWQIFCARNDGQAAGTNDSQTAANVAAKSRKVLSAIGSGVKRGGMAAVTGVRQSARRMSVAAGRARDKMKGRSNVKSDMTAPGQGVLAEMDPLAAAALAARRPELHTAGQQFGSASQGFETLHEGPEVDGEVHYDGTVNSQGLSSDTDQRQRQAGSSGVRENGTALMPMETLQEEAPRVPIDGAVQYDWTVSQQDMSREMQQWEQSADTRNVVNSRASAAGVEEYDAKMAELNQRATRLLPQNYGEEY